MGVALLAKPPVLLLPGWLNSDESHWQSRWAALHSATPVQQHDWLTPLRGDWLSAFETHLLAAHAANTARHGPHLPRFAVAAHSLGCHLLAAWLAHSAHRAWVVAALVVAPPDLSQADLAPAVARWAPAVTVAFPPALREATVVLGSDDDPYASSSATAQLAAQWGVPYVESPGLGHMNGQSQLDDWPAGWERLQSLIHASSSYRAPAHLTDTTY